MPDPESKIGTCENCGRADRMGIPTFGYMIRNPIQGGNRFEQRNHSFWLGAIVAPAAAIIAFYFFFLNPVGILILVTVPILYLLLKLARSFMPPDEGMSEVRSLDFEDD